MKIKISEVKKIREELNMTHLVIFAIDKNNNYHVATHGDTVFHAKEAAEAGNNLKKKLGFPDNLCKSKPLERIHRNCEFYKQGRPGGYEYGLCCYECGKQIEVNPDGKACHNFEPKE